MSDEIPASAVFDKSATLADLEGFALAVRDDVKLYMALLAIALGRILLEHLFLRVAPSFKAYCRLERCGIAYPQAHKLATAGRRFLEFREEFQEHEIEFRDCVSKTALIDPRVARNDPMYFERFRELSADGLRKYNRRMNDINVSVVMHGKGTVHVKASSLFLDDKRIPGVNLEMIKAEVKRGRRPVVLFASSDAEARRIRRAAEKATGGGR